MDGAHAHPTALFPAGRTVEFVATFNAAAFQHVGFGDTLNDTPWAIFSTGSDGTTLQARTNDGNGTNTGEVISGSWFGTPHRFRVEWSATQVEYSIDGVVVATHTANYTGSMHPIASNGAPGGPTLSVDWLDMTPYTASCVYQSHTFDAQTAVQWTTLDRVVTLPGGTGCRDRDAHLHERHDVDPVHRGLGHDDRQPAQPLPAVPSDADDECAGRHPGTRVGHGQRGARHRRARHRDLQPGGGCKSAGECRAAGAAASDNAGVTALDYRVTGGAVNDVVIGTGGLTIYGWLAYLNTTAVPDGTYTLQSVST